MLLREERDGGVVKASDSEPGGPGIDPCIIQKNFLGFWRSEAYQFEELFKKMTSQQY